MKKLILSAALLALCGTAAANGGESTRQSEEFYIKAGESNVNGGPHSPDHAGIAYSGFGENENGDLKYVDFQGMPALPDSNGVRRLLFPVIGSPASHIGIGNYSFLQIGDDDLWIGEWSKNYTSGIRQVYYSGAESLDAVTTVPTSGVVDYDVKGINNYKIGNLNLLQGTLTADFGSNTLSGSIMQGDIAGDYFKVSIVDNQINPAEASFNGKAHGEYRKGDTFASSDKGTSKGHFFGADAKALAGVAEFKPANVGGRDFNTAFGGTRTDR